MPSVTGYQAGVETTDVQLSYALETAWATLPAVAFKALRITGESMAGQKQRTRFNEMTGVRQASPSVTQQESAGGGINFNLSYGTFDDLMAVTLGNDWTTALAIDGISGDISTVASGNKLTSTLSTKFANIVVGQYIRLYGFTASSGANNGIYRVSAKANNQDITLAGKTVINETPTGTAAKIRGSMLRNGNQVQSLYMQKRTASNQFFRYPGVMFGGMALQGGIGQAFTGSFTSMAKDETFNASDASTGAVSAAPSGGFFNAVAAFGGIQLNDVAIDAVVQSCNLNVTREGAAMDYGMGSPSAQGARWGQVNVGGTLTVLFRNETLYNLFKSEANRLVSFTIDRKSVV